MIGLLLATGCPRPALDPRDPPDALDQPLPLDPTVRTGALPNGLRWYVAPNADPPDRVVVRLVVRVGSVLEDEDQVGVAHLVEHLAFAGTARMPGPGLTTWLDALGQPFGPHVDAHTAFDQTTFDLTVDPPSVPTALAVLADWSHGLRFDDRQLDQLRPILLGEWLDRPGPQHRIEDATSPVVYQGSPYATRPPAGTAAGLLALTADAAARFYRDWYRPDLMAVIVVGPVDPDAVEQAIVAEFAAATNPVDERPRVQYEIPEQRATRYVILADPDVATTAVQVLSEHDDFEADTLRERRDDLVEQVAFDVLRERLAAAAAAPESPLLTAGAGQQRLSPTEGADVLAAGCRSGDAARAYGVLLDQVAAVQERGFSADEFAGAVERVGTQYEALVERPRASDARADDLVGAFTTGEAALGSAADADLARRFLPGLTVADLDRWGRDWMRTSRVVMVIQPPGDVPTAEALAAVEPLAGAR